MIHFGKASAQERGHRAERILAFGFLAVILLGTVLLALPAAARSGQRVSLFDSLFTATSAVCVTGLVAADTATAFSPFGQAVILALIQIGGLGFMMFATMIMVMLGRRITLRERMLIRESMNSASLSDLAGLAEMYLLMALCIEGVGAVALSGRFVPLYGWKHGLWMALFHSVSAFCNAGFDLFGNYTSLTAFAGDPFVLFTISALIILGGLGFSVVLETARSRNGLRGLSLHTHIVLVSTLILLLTGTGFFLFAERENAATLGGHGAGGQILNAFFQSVTLRTAGFNTVDQSMLRDGSKLFACLLMAIGASPASTGGGIKTTTVAVLFFLMRGVVRGDREVNIARRRLSGDTVRRALAVASLFVAILIAGTLAMVMIENGRFSLADILFEASSAMGTVGVSAVGTPNLHAASRAVLIPMMFLGRVGPLTLAIAVARRQNRLRSASRYPEEKIMIG